MGMKFIILLLPLSDKTWKLFTSVIILYELE